MTTDAASGVIRAYDVVSGALSWAWEPGAPVDAAAEAVTGYTRGSPNAWTLFSADEKLADDLCFGQNGEATGGYRRWRASVHANSRQ